VTEPRDYHSFLRAKPGGRLGDVLALLPAPPPRATLWTQSSRLVGSALLPLGLWIGGWLDPIDVVLLYFAEGAFYCLTVAARILFTAAPGESRARPRVMTTLIYLLSHGAIWSALVLLTLACIAPNAHGMPITEWVGAVLARFRERSMWSPAVVTAVALAQDAARRSDYIDAYLTDGPHEVARYGYSYPMALTFLLVTAGVLSVAFRGADMKTGDEIPRIAPVFFAAWLLGWRLVMQLLTLTLPIWGRATGRYFDAVADSLHRSP
jgi:hypothetical protein